MPTRPFIRRLSHIVLAGVVAFTLVSCGNTTKPGQDTAHTKTVTLSAKQLLAMAASKSSPEREHLILQAAQAYITENKLNRARDLLVEMDTDALSDTAYIKHTNLLAGVALQQGANFLAHDILTKPRLEQQWVRMSPQLEIQLRDKRAQVFALLGDAKLSVSERIKLSALLTQKKAEQDNQNALWQSLMMIPYAELQELAQQAPTSAEQGWYSLAALSKNNQTDLEHQREQLQSWLHDWRNHPARNNLPNDLRLLQSLIEKQPKHLALLLPLEGKLAEAGEAVRDGFFSAYYQALSNGRNVPEIRQYDSSGDIISAYQQAVNDGADLIIGPVDKEKVTELSLMPSLPVPLLSLNYPDSSPAQPLQGFYQFGLAVEDEARQVARQAYLEGHRQAMIIIPTQEWSERSAQAFTQEWEKLGGVVVNRTQFQVNANYSRLVKDAMQIEQSQIRARELQTLLGEELQSLPRSRSDVDMIFLIAAPAQARQIKPTFAFHYAGKIPVYATSQIYSGDENAKADRDLNGVRFNSMPWIFDNNNPEKQAIAQYTKSAAVYGRLHALGADAFRLYARLPQLAQVPQMRIYGATGSLRMLEDGRIEREQTWARFRNGIAQPLPMVIDENEQQY